MTRRFHALCSTLTVAAVCLVPGLAAAQQQPGTNVPTPLPPTAAGAEVGATPAPFTPGLFHAPGEEPVIDADTTRTTYPNRPLLVTGVVLLGASYGASAIVAGISDRAADDKLYYPVAGPWLDLNHRGCDVSACSNNRLDRVLLVGDGIIQGAGALGMLLSLVFPEKTTRHWYLIGNREVTVIPQLGPSVMGLGAVGRF